MKFMQSSLRSLLHLFFPRTCAACGRTLVEGEHLVCTACRWNMPLTNTWHEERNPIREKLHAMVMAEQACSFFYYQKQSGYDRIIHKFKYNGKSLLGYEMGRWFGEELQRSGLYEDIDLIIPVPLHSFRRIKRGYNQSEYLARGIGRALRKQVCTECLIRKVHNRSQTQQDSANRWENVSGIFSVRKSERLEGKHLLIVDDVLTTGATLESCIGEIRNRLTDCRISVVTLAVSPRDFI